MYSVVLFYCCIMVFISGQNESTFDYTTENNTFTTNYNIFTANITSVTVREILNSVASSFPSEDTLLETTNDFSDVDPESEVSVRQCPEGDSKPCIVKCCPLGQSIGPNRECEPTDLKFRVELFGEQVSNINVTGDTYHFIYGNPCIYGRYRLEPRVDSNDEFHILKNGSIRAPYLFPFPLMPEDYCLEVFQDDPMEEEDVLPLICFKEPAPEREKPLQYILYPIGLLISVPFLIVTMLVYCLIPELRDLHGKSLACHVMCLAVGYIFLAAVQLVGETMNKNICIGFAFMIHFSFVACFFWLNLLCIDTWWNVRANVKFLKGSTHLEQRQHRYMCYYQLNGEVAMKKTTERKAFIWFSLYAWLGPVLFVSISMIMDLMPTIPSSYLKPHFGENKCWFNSEEAEVQYFYGPVGFLIGVNVLLFISAAVKIFTHKWKCNELKRTPRQTFRMCLTLFGVMGINWVMEVVSWFAGGPDYIWYVTDVINTLQGIIIFCIFVLEPRVRDLIRLQLWPKISEMVCQRTPNNGIIVYRSPKKASDFTNNV